MITLTYNEARAFSRSRTLVEAILAAKLPFPVAYNLRKILDQVGKAAQAFDIFEQNLQKDIADKYGERDADGALVFEWPTDDHSNPDDKSLKFKEETRGEANKEMFVGMSEMSKKTVEINRDKLDFSAANIQVGVQDMILLDLIVQDLETAPSVPSQSPEAVPVA